MVLPNKDALFLFMNEQGSVYEFNYEDLHFEIIVYKDPKVNSTPFITGLFILFHSHVLILILGLDRNEI